MNALLPSLMPFVMSLLFAVIPSEGGKLSVTQELFKNSLDPTWQDSSTS